jgi:hypothetical protein
MAYFDANPACRCDHDLEFSQSAEIRIILRLAECAEPSDNLLHPYHEAMCGVGNTADHSRKITIHSRQNGT